MNIQESIAKIIKSESCVLGDVIPSNEFLAKIDKIADKNESERIFAAFNELPKTKGFIYKMTRVGRIGIEHRIYRADGAWTLADSRRVGKDRCWFKLNSKGDEILA
jgi:hypothetical protein